MKGVSIVGVQLQGAVIGGHGVIVAAQLGEAEGKVIVQPHCSLPSCHHAPVVVSCCFKFAQLPLHIPAHLQASSQPQCTGKDNTPGTAPQTVSVACSSTFKQRFCAARLR